MSPDIYVESMHIGYAVLWGLELAVFYDMILIFRNALTHKNFFIYAEDFFYWMFSALFVFDHLYKIGNGQMRWYMVLGIGIGMLTYKLAISRWLVKYVSFVVRKIFNLFGKMILFLFKPFRYIVKIIRKAIKLIKTRLFMVLRLIKKKLTLGIKMIKIALCKR